MGIDGPREPPDDPADGDDPEQRPLRVLPGSGRAVDPVAIEREQRFGSRALHRLTLALAHTKDSGDRGPDRWADVDNASHRPERDRIHLTEERIRHILIGDVPKSSGGHRHDSGIPGKHTFPPDWDDRKIVSAILDVARHPDWPPGLQRHGTWYVEGWRNDVHIVAIVDPDGWIRTGHPKKGTGVHINDKDGNPIPTQWPERE